MERLAKKDAENNLFTTRKQVIINLRKTFC